MLRSSPIRFLRAENGAAAVETALILPFLVLLYFGMIDLTQLISANRKITYAASVVADSISQNRTSLLQSNVNDYYQAVNLVMSPLAASDVSVRVYGYRKVGAAMVQQWKDARAGGPGCNSTPDTTEMLPLTSANNDVIVAITCMRYTPYVATFLGEQILGATSFNVEYTVMVRPRSSLDLTCYETTVGGTKCT